MKNKIENCPLYAGQARDYFVPAGQQEKQQYFRNVFMLVQRYEKKLTRW
jgi:hypothetical protein